MFRYLDNDYIFFAGYTVLQFIVLSTAWSILGGYCGYVNFGSAGFSLSAPIPVSACTRSDKASKNSSGIIGCTDAADIPLPLPALIIVAECGRAVGWYGYLTLRLRGVFFAIATLALAVVLQTFIVNWSFVGGSRGAYVIPPNEIPSFGPYIQYLFVLMLVLVIISLTCARLIERSRLGYGFATIRDDELAAEACGVPTLRLKLIATVLSGALMGMAGARFLSTSGISSPVRPSTCRMRSTRSQCP